MLDLSLNEIQLGLLKLLLTNLLYTLQQTGHLDLLLFPTLVDLPERWNLINVPNPFHGSGVVVLKVLFQIRLQFHFQKKIIKKSK
jgi:hypothetical protein